MLINTRMTFKELVGQIKAQLESRAPLSRFSGKPLTLVGAQDFTSLTWENCTEPDWWVGAEAALYTKQHRQPVTDDEIVAAAYRAGVDEADLAQALMSRPLEAKAHQEEQERLLEPFREREAARQLAQDIAAKERLIANYPFLTDPASAARAEARMRDLLSAHPGITHMTRKGHLRNSLGQTLAIFDDRDGLRAWLFQHGYRASIDDRHKLLEALS